MKLATIRIENPKTISEAKDGRLAVVSSDNTRAAAVPPSKFPNLISALENWKKAEEFLRDLSESLEKKSCRDSVNVNTLTFMAPLPRTYAWLDGSAFLQHVLLVRRARNAEPPEDLYTVPLMYQGMSDYLLGPNDDIQLLDESFGLDFEGEVAVILDEVPLGTTAKEAVSHVKLLLLMNDISLRNLIPREVQTGFGFIQGKPSSAFAPFAVTPDELGTYWRDGRVHLPLESRLNGAPFGQPNAGEMHFSFFELIAHAARTRTLGPGTILGSGTVSNKDDSVGSSCIVEKRMLEKINTGETVTPYMKAGDVIRMEMVKEGVSVFGKIEQKVVFSAS